ncbi:MAG: (d)CMP kinase [Bacteroidales bacterium]
MESKNIIIAIDGHSSCGKSTFARAIAARMNFLYIDSGAMYRAVTLACMERGMINGDTINKIQLHNLLDDIRISFRKKEDSSESETYLNGQNVENRIRSIEVASNVSLVSSSREVREKMVALQREMGKSRNIVMDGRDIGTVVFPDAELKIFMTARADIRAERRYKELTAKGMNVNFEDIKENIINRDKTDESRKESPLLKARDAVIIDNSDMTPEDQMIWFDELINRITIL